MDPDYLNGLRLQICDDNMFSWCNLRPTYFNQSDTPSVQVGRAMWNGRKIVHYMSHCRKCENDHFKNFCRREVRMLIKNAHFGAKNSCFKNLYVGEGNENIEKNAHMSLQVIK
jgi:hypothetical protein